MTESVCVGALVVRRDDGVHVLLGKRSSSRAFYPGVWDMPGGHCDAGETVEQALSRGLQEEIGITPTAWRLLGDFTAPARGDDEPLLLHVYEVTEWTGTPSNRAPEEHAELTWFTIDDACELVLAHDTYPHLFRRLGST